MPYSHEKTLFTDTLAEACKVRAGQLYRPANGTEGDLFEEVWCSTCQHYGDEGHCEILARTFWCGLTDPDYPHEWQYRADGQPCCTAYKEIPCC